MTRLFYRLITLLVVAFTPLNAQIHDLVVGGDYNFPPYEFLDSTGRADGYNVELMREIGKTMGWKVQFRLMPWKEVVRALEDKKIDMIQGLSFSKTRDSIFDFTTPHQVNYHSIFKRKSSSVIHSIDDLINKEVVVQQGDIMHEFVLKNQFTDKVFTMETRLEALKALNDGEYDAAIAGKYQSLYLIKEHHLDNLVAAGSPVASTNYCFAVAEGNLELKNALDQALAILKANGKYQEIYNRWFGVMEEPVNQSIFEYDYALGILYSLLAIFFLIPILVTYLITKKRYMNSGKSAVNDQFVIQLIDNYPGIIFLKDYKHDPKGRYLVINQAYADYLKVPKESVIGKNCYDIFPQERAQVYWQNDQINLKNNCVTNLNEHLTMDEESQLFLTTQFPVKNHGGEVIGVGGICIDITRQEELAKMLQHEAERFNLLMENIEEGIIVTDINANIHQINKIAGFFLSLNIKKVIGKYLSEFMPEIELINDAMPHLSINNQIIQRKINGFERTYKVNQIPVTAQDKQIVGRIIILKEVKTIPVKREKEINTLSHEMKKSTDIPMFSSTPDMVNRKHQLPEINREPGQKLIMLLDDEDAILRIGQELLQILGYAVIIAHEGSEAVDYYRQAVANNIKIDLLIFDLTIPLGMGGREALARIQEMDSTVQAIVCSGYSNDEVMSNHEEHGFSAVLSKPYTIDNLTEVLDKIFQK